MRLLVFSRRDLQQRLDALEANLPSNELKHLAAHLDRRGARRLPAMWETVWLHALGQLGPFDYEHPLPDGSKPDFRFELPFFGGKLEVVGDITCVSDRGVHEKNPVDLFWKELLRHIRAAKLNPNHFHCQFGHRTDGEWPDIRDALLLPPRSQMAAFVKQHFVATLRSLAASGAARSEHIIVTDNAHITLNYDTSKEFSGSSHIDYTAFKSPTRNPIFNQLSLKETQLRSAPVDALRVVILCDAGCDAMRKNAHFATLSAADISSRFLRKSTVIDLVVLVGVEARNPLAWHDRQLQLHARIVGAPAAPSTRRTIEAGSAVQQYLDRALAHLPTPVLDCHNASLRTNLPSPGNGTLGIRMSDHKICLSARVVLDLLAGKISSDEFQRTYGWGPGSERNEPNPFARKLAHGQLITAAQVTSADGADDDWLEFSFGDSDPAAAPFQTRT